MVSNHPPLNFPERVATCTWSIFPRIDISGSMNSGGPLAPGDEAVKRLIAAGATAIHEDVWDGVPDQVVMADPEGNEFDVL